MGPKYFAVLLKFDIFQEQGLILGYSIFSVPKFFWLISIPSDAVWKSKKLILALSFLNISLVECATCKFKTEGKSTSEGETLIYFDQVQWTLQSHNL